MASDARIVREGTLPTPFTAAQIRVASPPGTTMVVRTWRRDEGESLRRITFTACDEQGADREHVSLAPDGDGRAEIERETWLELQAHAAFPEGSTTVSREAVATPLGDLDCLRYDVAGRGEARSFWFDLSRPGMPVRVEAKAGGELVMRMEIVDHETGAE